MYNNYISSDQKLLAIAAHVTYFLGGVGFIIAPLIIYLLKKDDPFVREHAKQALAAHLFLLILSTIIGVLCYILIGFLLLPILAIVGLIFFITSILAAIKAADGQLYYYPLIQSFVDKF
ncbi:MAG: DUF4870 domain-containing protein [Pelosinus sp.]|nr:DUF4870 domain-containing protein [Pelosinus sp.]